MEPTRVSNHRSNPADESAWRHSLHLVSAPSGLWTPAQGSSGLVVVARSRPLAVVLGGRIRELAPNTDSDSTDFAVGSSSGGNGRRITVTLDGLVVISASRQGEPKRVIGHPELASGTSVRHRDTLYVSVSEAVYRESQGEDVEIHLHPTPQDDEALAGVRLRARRRWEGDHLPDGWTRPLPPASKMDDGRNGEMDKLPEELRTLAERFSDRASRTEGTEGDEGTSDRKQH